MRVRTPVLLFLLAVTRCAISSGQSSDSLKTDDGDLRRVFEESTEEEEDSQLMDRLTDLMDRPLDLNSAGVQELLQVPGIDATLASRIVEYREMNAFDTVDELTRIEGLDSDRFERIRPFVMVNTLVLPDRGASLSLSLRGRAAYDLQRRRGFREGLYLGSPLRFQSRLCIGGSNPSESAVVSEWAAGMVTDKDAGERRFNSFTASFLDVKFAVLPVRALVGDYVVEMGQGLFLSGRSGYGKGSDVLSPVGKGGLGVRPYLSTAESFFLRGVALTIDLKWFSPSLFYSNKPLSGTVNESGEITSLYTAGLFRTDAERLRKNTSRERLAGIVISGSPLVGFGFGIGGFNAKYARPNSWSESDGPFREISVAGMNLSWTRSSFSLFAEFAGNRRRSVAAVSGAVVRPARDLFFVIAGRRYPKVFGNPYGIGFGESGGSPHNESGFYTGAGFSPTTWLNLSVSYDLFFFPAKTSVSRFPSGGNDCIILGEFRLSRYSKLEFRYRERNKPAAMSEFDLLMRSNNGSGLRSQQNHRGTLEYRPSSDIRWRSRVEITRVSYPQSGAKQFGILIYQDLGMALFRGLHLNARLSIFDTDSFDSRIYEFESDVHGGFANPALYGRGLRFYLIGRLELVGGLSVEMKYGVTAKEDVKRIGTGLDEIDGDTESRLTVQCLVNF